MKKIFILLFSIVASISITNAEIIEKVQIGDLYYNLDTDKKTAVVTSSNEYSYSGDITIPASVNYNSIPYDVKSIDKWAFSQCFNLKSIVISNGITSIGYGAFSKCERMTSIQIPNTVAEIEREALYSCIRLDTLDVAKDNPYFCSVNDVLFNKAKTILIQYPLGKKDSLYVIPSTVNTIGRCAFEWSSRLKAITIPSSVTTVEDLAFAYCYYLNSITCFALNPPAVGNSVFIYINKSTCVLHVPTESITAYLSADQWNEFTSISPVVEAVENTSVLPAASTTKLLHNGQLLIRRADRTYTLTGAEVK